MKKEDLDKYNNALIKIELKPDDEVPYMYGTFIACLKYDTAVKGYILNHPYDIKKNDMIAGEAGFDPIDILNIKYATAEEARLWGRELFKFHSSIVKAKGYDSVGMSDIEINLNIE